MRWNLGPFLTSDMILLHLQTTLNDALPLIVSFLIVITDQFDRWGRGCRWQALVAISIIVITILIAILQSILLICYTDCTVSQ